MKQHIFEGTTPPTSAPLGIGHHYVDTVNKKTYISVGTATSSDWKTTDESDIVQNSISPLETAKAPSQAAVYNALSSAGSLIPKTIASNLTVLSGFVLIRSYTKISSGIKLKIENDALLKII